MIRFLLIAILAVVPVFAASNGEATGAYVLATGWEAEVRLHNTSIGGTAALNWDTNHTINPSSPPAIRFTVQSPGRTGATTNAVTRYIYASDNMRKAYPNEASKDERTDGSDAVIKLALTDYIHTEDIITEISFANAWYTGAIVTTLSTAITNGSSQLYHYPIVNQLNPPNTRVGTNLTLWFGGGHWSAENGVPIEWMEVIAEDESGNSVTNVPSMTWQVDTNFNASAPANAYAVSGVPVTLNLSTLDDSELVTVRFRAAGRIGNAASIYDSELNDPGVATPNQLPFNKTYWKRAAAYGGVAVVGTAGATPTIHPDGTDPTTIPSTDYYGTGNASLVAAKAYNLANYGHDDCGGSTIYFRTGETTWSGASGSTAGASKEWVYLKNYPGDTWTITGHSGNSDINDKIWVEGAVFDLVGNPVPFSAVDELVFDQCTFTTSGAGPFQNIKVLHVMRSTAGAGWTIGWRTAAGGTAITHGIFRENDFSGIGHAIQGPQTFVGNYIEAPGSSFQLQNGSSTWNSFATRPGPDLQVWYNNFIGMNATTGGDLAGDFAITNGIFFANNIMEGMINSVAFTMFSDNGLATTNCLVWNNLSRGVRHQFAYNETGSTPTPRNRNVMVNVIADTIGNAHDLSAPQDGARIGGWSFNWRVGSSVLLDLTLTNMPTHGFPATVALHSYHTASASDFTWTNYYEFYDDQAWVGTGGTAGGGDYRLLPSSKVFTNTAHRMRFVMPYDLHSNPRNSNSVAGPLAPVQYHVKKTGNDSNIGSEALPFLTVQKAADLLIGGAEAIIWPGYYNETVITGTGGTSTNYYVKFIARYPATATEADKTRVKAFRVRDQYSWLEGLHLWRGGADINDAIVRVEYNGTTQDGSFSVFTNNVIGFTPLVVSTNTTFGTNSMTSSHALYTNFLAGDLVFLGADSVNHPTNGNRALTVLSNSVDGLTIYFNEAMTNDAGTYWTALFAGQGNQGYQGINIIPGSGSSAASDITIVSNVFDSVFGNNINLNGNPGRHIVRGNTIQYMRGRYWVRQNASSYLLEGNLVYKGTNIIFHTDDEIDDPAFHPPGGSRYDFNANHMDAQVTSDLISTNGTVRNNWFEDIDNQAGLWTGRNFFQYDLQIYSNVFVGIPAQGGASIDGLKFYNNTIYRVGFDPANDRTLAFGWGGTSNNTNMTGFVHTNNVYVDIGSHAGDRMTEAASIDEATTPSPVLANNYVAGPESTGWEAKTGVDAGYDFNGGNPLFVDPLNPRGADGLPFTDDDGLRSLPTSVIALNNLGALVSLTITQNEPVAHFTAVPPTYGWFDVTGTNYSLDWVAIPPGMRGANMRPWRTPESLGAVPCRVKFDASTSIGGINDSNAFGIMAYGWSFGDGSFQEVTFYPTNEHTYLTTGQMQVVLWVTNSYGNVDSFTNLYNINPKTVTNQVLYVDLVNGSDANPGTNQNAAKQTISSTVSLVGPGSYVAVLGGDHNVTVNLNGADGAATNRIHYIGYGATVNNFEIRKLNYTVSGFEVDADGVSAGGAAVLIYTTASQAHVSHNRVGGFTNRIGFVWQQGSSGSPYAAASNCFVTNNLVQDLDHIVHNVQGLSNRLQFNWIERGNGQVDIFRVWGDGHLISYNFIQNISLLQENHSDFWQTFGPASFSTTNDHVYCRNIVFEKNFIKTSNIQICQLEMFAQTNVATLGYMSNVVVRNNLFLGSKYGANLDMDGTKWYNNLFLDVNIDSGHIFFFGGTKGSAYGTELLNNIFGRCGSNPSSASFGWYDYMEAQGITNYSITADYNMVFGTAFAAKNTAPPDGAGRWGSTMGTPPAATEANGINGGNPLFVDEAHYDFRLSDGSPALAAGVTISGFNDDFYGTDRGSEWDIGPIQGSVSEPPPPNPGILSFSSSTYTVGESDGTATITVTRTSGTDGAVSVVYATSNGSATAGVDYTTAGGTLNWMDGESASKTFTVPITSDTDDESDETVLLTLSSPGGGATLGTSSATLTITDDDDGDGLAAASLGGRASLQGNATIE